MESFASAFAMACESSPASFAATTSPNRARSVPVSARSPSAVRASTLAETSWKACSQNWTDREDL
ncbi:MAG: hypothetical protein QM765_29245 [Myxococcales bacterium]